MVDLGDVLLEYIEQIVKHLVTFLMNKMLVTYSAQRVIVVLGVVHVHFKTSLPIKLFTTQLVASVSNYLIKVCVLLL